MSPLKLRENGRHGLPHDIGQHIQPSPVRHADDETVRAQLGRPVNRVLQGGDDGLPAIEPEALGGVELAGQEVLEGVREAEALEDVHLLLPVALQKGRVLHPLADPVALLHGADVHVLHADGAAVGLAEALHDLAQRDLAGHAGEVLQEALVAARVHALEVELAVHVGGGVEAVEAHRERLGEPLLGVQVGPAASVARPRGEGLVGVQPQRVQVGRAVPVHLVRPDQVRHAQRVGRQHGRGGRRRLGLAGHQHGGLVELEVGRAAGLAGRLEEQPPALGHGAGVGLVLLQHGLYVESRRRRQEAVAGCGRSAGLVALLLMMLVKLMMMMLSERGGRRARRQQAALRWASQPKEGPCCHVILAVCVSC